MKEITLDAAIENINAVTEFVDAFLDEAECPVKARVQINIVIDEIFGNIAQYAYTDKPGQATVRIDKNADSGEILLTFIDNGIPYNPLEKKDPDISLSIEEREIGGLGIYLVKKNMDRMEYKYENGRNYLILAKRII